MTAPLIIKGRKLERPCNMASMNSLRGNNIVRLLLLGYPGTAKTGSLASLANAGFKLRILDFDGNPESLKAFTSEDADIDILSFEDPLGVVGPTMGVKGVPSAFARAWSAMDRWKYEDPTGVLDEKTGKRWVDLGASKDWGQETIVILDGMTGLSTAAMRRAMFLGQKTLTNVSQPTWGLAQKEEEMMIEQLTRASNPYHSIVISHVKLLGPKPVEKSDDMLTAHIKTEAAELIPTKLFPTAVGRELAQTISGHFPYTVLAENQVIGKKVKRRLSFQPRPDIDLKLAVKNPAELTDLGPEDGLLRIFRALGAEPPRQAVPATVMERKAA